MGYQYQGYYPQQQYQYLPQYQQQYQQQYQPQQNSSGLIWVSGETEAQNYPVNPNSAIAMWDANASAVYLKQADPAGRPTFKVFDLVERNAKPVVTTDDFVTRKEFDDLVAKIEKLNFKEEEA